MKPAPHTAQVRVVDLTIARRAVTIPAVCKCGADLAEPHAIDEWQLADERWRSRLGGEANADPAGMEGDEGNGTLVDYDSGSDSGPGDTNHIGPVWLACSTCKETLASGTTLDGEPDGDVACIVRAEGLLKAARDLLRKAGAVKSAQRARLVLSSLRGALSNARHRASAAGRGETRKRIGRAPAMRVQTGVPR